ncbi:TPA: restriction endonuclease subunit S [Enterobacter roggenkampii]|uniref:restriction endonuclease subunit S n=1 Tax=Enterobacter roggenkampii TaxID=1812935 RepID=UPI002814F1B3|nr:restriction endonuclease subunit S [Enterobacter roggenkampii]
MAVEKLITDHFDTWTSALQTRATAGRGSNGKIDLYGIKKLRELILELAVRGKLVPQDPNDEPASELLKRIAAEKAELVKQGKIKKQKPLPEISEDEKPFELPKGWEWVRLGFITNYGECDKAEPTDADADTWIVELEDIEKSTSRLLNRVTFSERPYKSSKNKFNKNDVLYGKLRPYLDKVLVADDSGVCTTEIIPIKVYGNILPGYLHLLLKSPRFIAYANESTHGMNLPRLGTDKAINAVVELTAIAEQSRIVNKVDELMSLCDQLEQQSLTSLDAHQQLVETLLATLTDCQNAEELAENWARISQHFDTLFTTEASIDALKQTILQLAVMGKLVPQFGGDTPIKETYETIRRIKEKLIKEKIYQKSSVLKPKSSKLSIPENWLHAQFGEVCCSIVPNRDKPKSFSGNIPWITLPSFDECNIYISKRNSEIGLSTEEVKAFNARIIPTGSVLMSCVGRFGLTMINKCEVVINQQIHAFIPLGGVVAEYLYFVIKASKKSLEESSTSTTIAYLNKNNCESIEFGLPPLEEQKRIVDKVNELIAICNLVKSRLQSAQQTQRHLTNALTDAALN